MSATEPLCLIDPASASLQPQPCKICQTPSPLFGVADFHKSCEEWKGLHLPVAGLPIYYRRCPTCRFTFTTAFDDWETRDFHQHIYNDEYLLVDPEFVDVRPRSNASLIAKSFEKGRDSIRLLDFGGGTGRLAEVLRADHFNATTYDPFSNFNDPPSGRFNLVTCFEVMEHTPNPRGTVAEMVALLEDPGIILFSTLLQPKDFEAVRLAWWYAAPRNGHVSLFSADALTRLFADCEMRFASFSHGLHIAYRDHLPAFADGIVLPR